MKVHLSLPVSDIQKTRAFYSQLFQSAPSKEKFDYIKFEPSHLALNISFHVGKPKPDVHLGLQVTEAKELNSEHARLGEFVEGERDTSVCCYASQDKFWVKDPDGYRWEIYRLVADTEQKMSSQSTCCQTDSAEPSFGPACC